ncbi:helix-turn-helix transcriptional regulator [Actinobacillus genomosp. 2]|uniref:XRE family transcriptional regulator n=1 Tax=Actinobacillus genomosp. 2 TaxID=230709 RepID=UPI00244310C6|nr:helix-turn-helix transcriptional regulator [Actinobacillus genomosp. 2]WGE32561.1 helix-turn-helix transcriptional regulator [Actinobacillus genomosp. 2]
MKSKFKNEYSIGTRIEERRNALNLSRNTVCEQLGGVALSTLQLWEKNEREPQAGMIIKLAEILKTTVSYLLKGEQQETKSIATLTENTEPAEIEEISMIDSFVSIRVSAGFGSFNEGVTEPDGQEPYADSLLHSLGVQAKHCAVFWASGSSMQPTITDGDQMLVDLSRNEVRGDNIYLVQNGDSVWVKRVKMLWDGVELISDNREEYEPIKISNQEAQNLQIIGQVVHVGHKLI